jgi:hypothetical protein
MCVKALRCCPSSLRSRLTAWPLPPSPSSSAGDDAASVLRKLLSAGRERRRTTSRPGGQSTHSTLYLGPASSIRSISSSVTGGGAADGSSTGVQTSRNQPSIPAGV